MARNVDLSEKLGLEGKPTITIKDQTITIDDSASTILQVFEVLDGPEGQTVGAVMKAVNLMLGKDGRKKLDALGLNFADWNIVANAAIELVIGSAEGEAMTPATTS